MEPTVIDTEVFKLLDRNKNGRLNLEELAPLIRSQVRAQQIAEYMRNGSDPSRGLTAKEFAAVFQGDPKVVEYYQEQFHNTLEESSSKSHNRRRSMSHVWEEMTTQHHRQPVPTETTLRRTTSARGISEPTGQPKSVSNSLEQIFVLQYSDRWEEALGRLLQEKDMLDIHRLCLTDNAGKLLDHTKPEGRPTTNRFPLTVKYTVAGLLPPRAVPAVVPPPARVITPPALPPAQATEGKLRRSTTCPSLHATGPVVVEPPKPHPQQGRSKTPPARATNVPPQRKKRLEKSSAFQLRMQDFPTLDGKGPSRYPAVDALARARAVNDGKRRRGGGSVAANAAGVAAPAATTSTRRHRPRGRRHTIASQAKAWVRDSSLDPMTEVNRLSVKLGATAEEIIRSTRANSATERQAAIDSFLTDHHEGLQWMRQYLNTQTAAHDGSYAEGMMALQLLLMVLNVRAQGPAPTTMGVGTPRAPAVSQPIVAPPAPGGTRPFCSPSPVQFVPMPMPLNVPVLPLMSVPDSWAQMPPIPREEQAPPTPNSERKRRNSCFPIVNPWTGHVQQRSAGEARVKIVDPRTGEEVTPETTGANAAEEAWARVRKGVAPPPSAEEHQNANELLVDDEHQGIARTALLEEEEEWCPVQPASGCYWDWPLSREEKKERVSKLHEMELLEEIEALRCELEEFELEEDLDDKDGC